MAAERTEWRTSEVFGELLDELRGLESHLLDHPAALGDEQSACESYSRRFGVGEHASTA